MDGADRRPEHTDGEDPAADLNDRLLQGALGENGRKPIPGRKSSPAVRDLRIKYDESSAADP